MNPNYNQGNVNPVYTTGYTSTNVHGQPGISVSNSVITSTTTK